MASTEKGRRALELLKDPGKLLTTILLGNTFVNVAASTIAAGIASELMPGNLGLGLGVLAITFVLLVIGEISPKTIARTRNRHWIEGSAYSMGLLVKILSPAAALLKYPVDIIDRFVPGRNHSESFKEAELNILMELAREEGFIGVEADVASAVLSLDERTCVSAMVSRERVVSFMSDWDRTRMIDETGKSPHTAYPYVDTQTGRMSGVVDVRDLLGRGVFRVREVPYFPESAKLSTVLTGLRDAGGSMGAVVDEYGDWTGIVSVNDILERAVFSRASGAPLPDGVTRSKDGFIVPAALPVDLLCSLFDGGDIEARFAESCGGLLQEITGGLPGNGDVIIHNGFVFRVLEAQGKSLKKIHVAPVVEK